SGETNVPAAGAKVDTSVTPNVIVPAHGPIPASFAGIDPTQPYSIDSNGVVQAATFMANGAETATLFESNKTTAHNVQFNTKFAGSGPVTGDFGLAYAKAT